MTRGVAHLTEGALGRGEEGRQPWKEGVPAVMGAAEAEGTYLLGWVVTGRWGGVGGGSDRTSALDGLVEFASLVITHNMMNGVEKTGKRMWGGAR